VHQFTDKRTGTARQLPLGISYVTDFDTYDAQEMQNFHAQHVHPGHAGTVAAPPALVDIAFDLALAATGHRKYDTAAATRGGSISKCPPASDNMPPGYTQSVRRTGCNTAYWYTALISGEKLTRRRGIIMAQPCIGGGAQGVRRGQGSGKGSGKEGIGARTPHVKYEHREWRRDTLR
jgi:hypothetical protein